MSIPHQDCPHGGNSFTCDKCLQLEICAHEWDYGGDTQWNPRCKKCKYKMTTAESMDHFLACFGLTRKTN